MDKYRECVSIGECRPPHKASKNTRDWCKGRIGIPHMYMYEPDHRFMYRHQARPNWRWFFESLVCFGCGRIDTMWARITCRDCGARRRVVWSHSPGLYWKSAWACECPDNRWPGYFEDRKTDW